MDEERLWEQDNYKAPLLAAFNHTIIEYDMKRANTSLAREFKLLPEEKIKEIENLPKQDREVTMGKIKRDTPGYSEKEKEAFIEARRLFFEENDLHSEDILDIKKDAIFVFKEVKCEKVTDNIYFRFKNSYSSYLRIGSLELFYHMNELDVKGISDDVYEEKHADFIGSLICGVIRRMEASSRPEALKYLRVMYDRYKWLHLDPGYYREFNARSMFHYKNGEYANEEYLGDLTQLDISCNLNLLLKIIRIIV